MAQKTLVIDLDRCIGCHACEVACKVENNVPMGVYYNNDNVPVPLQQSSFNCGTAL